MNYQQYFNLHANQVLTHFSLFIGVLTSITGVVAYSYEKDRYILALSLSILIVCIAFCFFHLYLRNRVLIKYAESKMGLDEKESKQEPWNKMQFYFTHHEIYKAIYIGTMILGTVSAVTAFIMLFY